MFAVTTSIKPGSPFVRKINSSDVQCSTIAHFVTRFPSLAKRCGSIGRAIYESSQGKETTSAGTDAVQRRAKESLGREAQAERRAFKEREKARLAEGMCEGFQALDNLVKFFRQQGVSSGIAL